VSDIFSNLVNAILADPAGVAQIIIVDIFLSGDNALIIGMAAASLSPELRKRAIITGMALAAALRIFFAIIASYLIAIKGILFIGGLLLAWVCWSFYKEIREHHTEKAEEALVAKGYEGSPRKQFWQAMFTITIADVSMSIDNVVAIVAIAKDNRTLMVFGLILSIIFMAFFATMIMRVMNKFPWLAYAGLLYLIFLAGKMLFEGWFGVGDFVGMQTVLQSFLK